MQQQCSNSLTPCYIAHKQQHLAAFKMSARRYVLNGLVLLVFMLVLFDGCTGKAAGAPDQRQILRKEASKAQVGAPMSWLRSAGPVGC